MKVTGFNHLSIGPRNLVETVKFGETVLGMPTVPSYNFGFKTKYLRGGDLQLHILTLDCSRIPEMKLLTEFAEQNEEGLAASPYLDRPHLKPARQAR